MQPQSPATASSGTHSFNTLALRDELLNNVALLGYESMTPIQAQSLPLMLDGQDVIAQAKTGSGKTAAFGLSLLQHLEVETYLVQSLVLCPTRELAEQVCQVLRQLARLMPNVKILNLSGGIPMKPQLDSLRHGAHIIVGTPGRVQKHLEKGSLSLKRLHTLVLDEADRMLDMGFYDDIKAVISYCKSERQTWLFSATYPAEIKSLAKQFMRTPKEVIIEEEHTQQDIRQYFFELSHQSEKLAVLKTLLLNHQTTSALVFCNTKQETADLAHELTEAGFDALALNGDMEQLERDQAMIRFVNQSCTILIATDVAARGLDIKELPLVINYDLAFEQDVHTHRVGRTGRAGSKGLALSLTIPADGERLRLIDSQSSSPLEWRDPPVASKKSPVKASMITVCLAAGKKDKIRPGDILGALTKDAGLPGDAIGKIDITALYSYVAIRRSEADKASKYFKDAKLKGRKVNVKQLK